MGLKWLDFSHAILKPSPKDVETAGMRENDILRGARNLAALFRKLAAPEDDAAGTELKEYRHKWNKIYDSGKAHEREWHSTWSSIAELAAPYIENIVGPHAHVLDIGCGTSSLGYDLCQTHGQRFRYLSLLDASTVCIGMLRERFHHLLKDQYNAKSAGAQPQISCIVGDCRKLPFDDSSVHVLLDKGTLDALDNEEDKVAMLSECKRIMASDCGVLLSISFGAANRLRFFARELPRLGMRNDIYTLTSEASRQPRCS